MVYQHRSQSDNNQISLLQEAQRRTRHICRRSPGTLQCSPPSEEPVPHGITKKNQTQMNLVNKYNIRQNDRCSWVILSTFLFAGRVLAQV